MYERITGVRGVFSTQLAYITSQRLTDEVTEYRLMISDADGARPSELFKSRSPMLSPAWSNDGKHLAYVSFHSGRPAIYIQHLASGQQRKVSGFKGLNSAPMWSPDDRSLVMTLSKERVNDACATTSKSVVSALDGHSKEQDIIWSAIL